jgi:hypothetical protein
MLMISIINRIHIQVTSCLAVLSGVASAKTEASSEGGSPREPFDKLMVSSRVGKLRAERPTVLSPSASLGTVR